MKTKNLFILFFVMASSLFSTAQALPANFSLMSLSQSEIYAATIQACQGLSRQEMELYSAKIDNYRAGRTPSAQFNDFLQFIYLDSKVKASDSYQFRKPSVWALWLTQNQAYQQGLTFCYGQDEGMKTYFNRLVFMADARGKIIAGVVFAGMVTAFGKVTGWVYQGSKIVGHALAYGLPAAGIALTVKDIVQQKETQNVMREECRKQNVSLDQCQAKIFLDSLTASVDQPEGSESSAVSNKDFFIGKLEQDLANLNDQLEITQDVNAKRAIQLKIQKKQKMLMTLKE